MKILAENIKPVSLDADKVDCILPFNPEYERYLWSVSTRKGFVYLHFENIFGSLRCPNYNLFLLDGQCSERRVLVGTLSFFGACQKSAMNIHGSAQSVKISESANMLAIASLLSSRQLHLSLVSQKPQCRETEVVIELVYLCFEATETP